MRPAIVITKPAGLLPVCKEHWLFFPLAVQPRNSLTLELPVLPHAPLYKPAVDVCIDVVHTAAYILFKFEVSFFKANKEIYLKKNSNHHLISNLPNHSNLTANSSKSLKTWFEFSTLGAAVNVAIKINFIHSSIKSYAQSPMMTLL